MDKTNFQDQYFTTKSAANYLSVTDNTLRLWRSRRTGPNFVKVTNRIFLYKKSEIDNYLQSRVIDFSKNR